MLKKHAIVLCNEAVISRALILTKHRNMTGFRVRLNWWLVKN